MKTKSSKNQIIAAFAALAVVIAAAVIISTVVSDANFNEDHAAVIAEAETKTETEAKTTLKEIDIYNLTQSEANQIWTSYLKGQCEYDLNDGNIKEFCTKFGFDINYAKN